MPYSLHTHVLAALAATLFHASNIAQGPAWTLQAIGAPSAVNHAMAFDSLRAKTVLFGGLQTAATLEWDGTSWTTASSLGPSARSGCVMAYDSQRARTVLFGGDISTSDTWEWNGAMWVSASTTGPSARTDAAMAYDALHNRTVLFGGKIYWGAWSSDETWLWDGSAWSQVATTGARPGARQEHAMAYDSQRGRVVLFGGRNSAGTYLGDTWEWDGTGWSHVAGTGPQPRCEHAMSYDSHRGRAVLYGGSAPGASLTDTWEWDGVQWTLSPLTGPSFQSNCAMSYDSVRMRTVLARSDTWELDLSPTHAQATFYGVGCGVPTLTIAPATASRPILGTTQVSLIDNAYLGIALVAWGHSNETHQGLPLPLPLDAVGMNGCVLLQSAEELASGCTSTSWTTAEHVLPIPFDRQLLGLHIYLQAWTFAPGYNPLGLATSNGIDLLIGDL